MARTQVTGDQVGDGEIVLGTDTGGTLPIGQGGTGQTGKTAAFDALGPQTSAGDLVAFDGTHAVRKAVGADGKILMADSGQADKLSWAEPDAAVLLHPLAWLGAANLTTETAFATKDSHYVYLGRCSKAITTCDILCRVTTAGVTITWAEVAIFRGALVLNGNASLTRLGSTDVSGTFNSTGIKKTTVSLSSVAAGDDLWAVFGSQATTPFQIRAGLADDIQSGAYQSATVRPSLAPSPQGVVVLGATVVVPWCQVKV